MPKAQDLIGKELSREETVDALLRRIAAYAIVLKGHVTDEDYKRLNTLAPFLRAADDLIAEMKNREDN